LVWWLSVRSLRNKMFHNQIYYTDEPLLSSDFCNNLIQKFDHDPNRHQGYTTGNNKSKKQLNDADKDLSLKIKRSTDLFLSPYPEYKAECGVMFDAVSTLLDQYQDLMEDYIQGRTFPFKNPKSRLTGFNLQKTEPGEYFHWHADDLIEGRWYRGMTYILYLNDIHDKGYTEFYDGTIIQPKQGHALLFPATWSYIHRGVSPASETKYICVGWWQTTDHVHYTIVSDDDPDTRIS